MIGELVPVVLLPRFTSLVGANQFTTLPIDVSAYSAGSVTLWRGQLKGTSSPTFSLVIQSSNDQIVWSDSGGYDPGADDSEEISPDLSRRWIRAKLTLTGTNPAVTCWCAGMLEKRVK